MGTSRSRLLGILRCDQVCCYMRIPLVQCTIHSCNLSYGDCQTCMKYCNLVRDKALGESTETEKICTLRVMC